jgi:alpha-L-rhamnosidase
MALTRWVGGLDPVAPGMQEVIVRRVHSSLRNIRVILPSPLGDLHAAWSTTSRGDELAVKVPRGMVAKLDLASVGVPARRSLLLDGRQIPLSDLSGRWYIIPEGAHRLDFRPR